MDGLKFNALGNFACKVRREMGNCEKYNKCRDKWDFERQKPCGLDPEKMSMATIIDLVEVIRDRVGSVEFSESDEPLYKEIDELFDCLELKLAGIVGAVGIGIAPWVANIKASEPEYEEGCSNGKSDDR